MGSLALVAPISASRQARENHHRFPDIGGLDQYSYIGTIRECDSQLLRTQESDFEGYLAGRSVRVEL